MDISNHNPIGPVVLKLVFGEPLTEEEQMYVQDWQRQSSFHQGMLAQLADLEWVKGKMREIHAFPRDEVRQMILDRIALRDNSWMAINPFEADMLAPFRPLPEKRISSWTTSKIAVIAVIKCVFLYLLICKLIAYRAASLAGAANRDKPAETISVMYKPSQSGGD